MKDPKLHPNIRVGHVHLRVADLERVVAFYCNAPGFTVAACGPGFGLTGAVLLAAGDYQHIGSKEDQQ